MHGLHGNPPEIKKAYPGKVSLYFNGAPGEIRTPDRLVRSQNRAIIFLYQSVTCGACPSNTVVELSVTYSSLCFQVSTNLAQSFLPAEISLLPHELKFVMHKLLCSNIDRHMQSQPMREIYQGIQAKLIDLTFQ